MATRQRIVTFALLLLLASLVSIATGQIEQIENRPIDGHRFQQGQSFRIECRAVADQELAVRLACPLAEFASGGLASTSCFENCGRPLCNQPNLNDCSATMPELLIANCSRTVRQVSSVAKEIVIVYTFNDVNTRHSGSYMCQFKTMRSSSYIIVDPAVTTAAVTSASSSPSSTSSTSSSVSPSTKSSETTATTTGTSASSSTTSSITSAVSTEASKKTAGPTTAAEKLTTASSRAESTSSTKEKILTLPPGPRTQPTTTREPGELVTSELLLKSGGWFYASIVGTLSGADVILVCLMIFVACAWLFGFLCIRHQVLATRYKSSKSTGGCCCSAILCLGQQQQEFQLQQKRQQQSLVVNGGLRDFAEQERRRGAAARLTAMSMNTPTAASANSVSSGQVYAEPDGVSYYSPDGGDEQLQHPLVLAGGGHGGDDAYYRLQQDFDDPLVRGGYGTNPRSTFFPRDQTGRHSFHNATPAARQRPGIPREMILSGGAQEDVDAEAEAAAELIAAAADPVMTRDDFRRQMEQQRREIESLRQQLRNSQLQLNQRASSTAALKQQPQPPEQKQQQQQQQQPPTSGDYDFLTRISAADTLPPSPPPPPPPSQQQRQQQQQPGLQSLPDDGSADLPPPPPPPPVNDLDNGGHRRSSLEEAYTAGQRY
ncbi:hypothetical protein BOX15_Mlig022715g1 [Macrostomum lignano]|uniref:Uncharacterized protein n=1 Tax=Macrostomum lignano TaxID=282301 RepID=A0A267DE06_9PLAT|nr:hypothetical protein BOX15_Mlig014581g1 [Macrostomum lignano]PAA51882.1 hypothetical protein BOX15_Mlig022715g1 [Macrostomum lignano]